MKRHLEVLLVSDPETESCELAAELRRGGFDPFFERVDNEDRFAVAIEKKEWDVILCAYRLVNFSARQALALLNEASVETPVLVLATEEAVEVDVGLIRLGAGAVLRGNELFRLIPLLERELRDSEALRSYKKSRERWGSGLGEEERISVDDRQLEGIGRLAGGVAQHINNILTVFKGYTELILRARTADEEVRKYATQMQKAGESGNQLIQKILAFASKTDCRFDKVSLNQVIEGVVEILEQVFRRSITIEVKPAQNIEPVYADPQQISRVLVNLAVNALEAMREKGGTLTFSSENVSEERISEILGRPESNRYIRVRVSDTGPGISAEALSQLFEPFYTTKREGEGMGLGLAVAYGIMRSHNGFIDVKSEPGKGSVFSLYFPVARLETNGNGRSEREVRFRDENEGLPGEFPSREEVKG